ncbi:sigma-70 family RNA polymerase sigma factor, partial [bacterium]|nr:sigma-70 family RNA polymerase sigma factor [bacterium]
MFWKTKDHEFEEVYTKYKKKVFYTCYRFTRNNSDALEVAQEVFLKISQKLGTLKNKDGISSWVYRITVNMSLNFLKKNYRLKEVSSDDFEAVYKEKGFDEVELKDYFDRVFKKLSP